MLTVPNSLLWQGACRVESPGFLPGEQAQLGTSVSPALQTSSKGCVWHAQGGACSAAHGVPDHRASLERVPVRACGARHRLHGEAGVGSVVRLWRLLCLAVAGTGGYDR